MRKTTTDASDEPGSGLPLHNRFDADRAAVADPHALTGKGTTAMTTGRGLPPLGSGDARPPVVRPGAHLCGHLPSRVGNSLRWPDGAVTGLDANPGVTR